MFQSARFKLTAWYVLIIMFISVLFSLVIFAGVNNEYRRFERFQQLRIQREQEGILIPLLPRRNTYIDPDILAESRNRIIFVLVLINLGILIISGGASYFLAGRTLTPIKEMVDEQNRFITDASHEFRTPITSLRSEIEVSLRDKNLSLQDAKVLLKSNLEEVINLQALSNHLMDLASYQKKNDDITLKKSSVLEVVESAYKKLLSLARKKNITFDLEVNDYLILADRQSLTELFVILLDNAVKYSPKNTNITVVARKTDHSLLISIKDEGIGIDKKDLPHIFDRFYRSDISRSKNKAAGFGLGLSIAKKIVELHKGTIEATSELKKGSVFTIRLPYSLS